MAARRSARICGQRFDDGTADLRADLLSALGDLDRDREDRLAPRRVAVRAGATGGRLPEQARSHRPPASRGPSTTRSSRPERGSAGPVRRRRGAMPRGRRADRPGSPRTRPRGRPVRRPGTSSGDRRPARIRSHQGRSPTAIRTSCGKVDSQSIARCGSSIAAISAASASTAAASSGVCRGHRRAAPRRRRTGRAMRLRGR